MDSGRTTYMRRRKSVNAHLPQAALCIHVVEARYFVLLAYPPQPDGRQIASRLQERLSHGT
jgi:hypothetical protein